MLGDGGGNGCAYAKKRMFAAVCDDTFTFLLLKCLIGWLKTTHKVTSRLATAVFAIAAWQINLVLR